MGPDRILPKMLDTDTDSMNPGPKHLLKHFEDFKDQRVTRNPVGTVLDNILFVDFIAISTEKVDVPLSL
jgi:hypothetical protein